MKKKQTLSQIAKKEDSDFEMHNKSKIWAMYKNAQIKKASKTWLMYSLKYEYSYHFRWLGRPIIQYPQDMIAIQEIIWQTKPDLIIETGVARGGSLIFYASLLELLGKGQVVGIDVDIKKHNKFFILQHKMKKRIKLIEGSSTDPKTVKTIYQIAKNKKRILLILDSDHTHKHVLKEMNLYSSLVRKDSYMVVFDTLIEDMPRNFYKNVIKRPWSRGNNPKSAIWEFLQRNDRFVIDKNIDNKLLISAAPDGYLKCIK
jgi:cephalosporin hydroxylase